MTLKARQQLFVEEYLMSFNATQAALAAGYSPRSAGSIGAENLKKPEIFAEIQRRMQATAMLADEVLMRLAAQARGSMADFLDNENRLDLAAGRTAEKLHLLKKMKQRRRIEQGDDDRLIETVETEFELYDAQRALELLGKHHGVLKEVLNSEQNIVLRVVYGERSDDPPPQTA